MRVTVVGKSDRCILTCPCTRSNVRSAVARVGSGCVRLYSSSVRARLYNTYRARLAVGAASPRGFLASRSNRILAVGESVLTKFVGSDCTPSWRSIRGALSYTAVSSSGSGSHWPSGSLGAPLAVVTSAFSFSTSSCDCEWRCASVVRCSTPSPSSHRTSGATPIAAPVNSSCITTAMSASYL